MPSPGPRLKLRMIVALLLTVSNATVHAAVIFMYHHVDESTPPSTSLAPREFEKQLEYLDSNRYRVVPLMSLLDSLVSGTGTAEGMVAITFDDGYRSVLTEALPLLESRGWPFTVFVSTQAVDAGYSPYLTWDELRLLGERGASIGSHSVSHAHLVRRLGGESQADWRLRARREISAAADRLAEEVADFAIPAFAYPYGEYTAELKSIVAELGLFGLGQHSGAVGPESDLLALPRYPVAQGLELDEFALRARSLALPVRYVDAELHIAEDARPPLGLAITATEGIRIDELACYATGQGRVPLVWNEGMHEFSVRPEQPLGPGRSKINCTAPSASDPGTYYWWGHLWMRTHADGSWYEE